ncbi:Secreted RxLR effector peptide protein [Phytophthora cinnamomi]|uniref:Secreted RxLR effector peptide protein n=1 Tax=Phytophthora cinnamomi TaxID=4785 RepID=UPI003559B70E|nr:Secreted RxLR effector peptide protein [Phytophthora cinnamomi]
MYQRNLLLLVVVAFAACASDVTYAKNAIRATDAVNGDTTHRNLKGNAAIVNAAAAVDEERGINFKMPGFLTRFFPKNSKISSAVQSSPEIAKAINDPKVGQAVKELGKKKGLLDHLRGLPGIRHIAKRMKDDQTANYRCRTEEDVAALLQLLETNRTLEYLEVVAPLEYDSYFDEFRAYHLQAMWAPRETLSLENKAAFLSVVSVRKAFTETSTKRSRQGSPRANGPVNEFDQLVLSKIFGFAADPVIRRVYFHRDIIRENYRFFQMAI